MTSFSIRCFASNYATATSTTPSPTTITANTSISYTTATLSEGFSCGQDDRSIVGPVTGGICGFVVLIAASAIAFIYKIKSKKEGPGLHLREASTTQEHSLSKNQVSYKAATDHHDSIITEDNYNNITLEHNTGNHMKKMMYPITQTHAENHYVSDIDRSIENPVNQGVVMQKGENLPVFSTVDKQKNQLIISSQDLTVYDRTGKIKVAADGLEEYNRLGVFQDEDTYDSADKNSDGHRNIQNNYDISFMNP